MAQLTRKQVERYKAKGKIVTGKSPASPPSGSVNPLVASSVQKLKEAKAFSKQVDEAMAPFKAATKLIKRMNASSKSPTEGASTDTARANKAAFASAGVDMDIPSSVLASRMFEIIHAKTKRMDPDPVHPDSFYMDEMRSHLFDVIGGVGWEQLLLIVAQCARLWGELPGPQNFDDTEKALMHTLSTRVTARDILQMAKAMDKVSKRG